MHPERQSKNQIKIKEEILEKSNLLSDKLGFATTFQLMYRYELFNQKRHQHLVVRSKLQY